MTPKTKKIIVIISTSIVTLIMGGGAIAKFVKAPAIMVDFTRLGVAQYAMFLGTLELFLLALFLYPKTVRIGYVLLIAYLAGAIATHLSHDEINFQPVLPMVIITLSVFFRDRSFLLSFLSSSNKFIN